PPRSPDCRALYRLGGGLRRGPPGAEAPGPRRPPGGTRGSRAAPPANRKRQACQGPPGDFAEPVSGREGRVRPTGLGLSRPYLAPPTAPCPADRGSPRGRAGRLQHLAGRVQELFLEEADSRLFP